MAVVKPFRAVRPLPEHAPRVAALPYDVMGSDEAREMVKGNPYSFLHVDKAEIDLDPSVGLYDEIVYLKARENLQSLIAKGILAKDEKPCYYIYQLVMDGRAQTGLVGCASIDDYLADDIKKHELTRADKEADRIRHVDVLDANTGPIFLTCPPSRALDDIMAGWMKNRAANSDFISDDGVAHRVWVVDEDTVVTEIEALLARMESLYIADGHHRCASAVRVGQRRRDRFPNYTGKEEFNFFLAVIFPSDHLWIMDYNRVVKDLRGLSPEAFIEKVSVAFSVEAYDSAEPLRPGEKHVFGMYMGGKWYRLTAKPGTYDESDPVSRLDVSILQNNLLAPILGVEDPRTDHRIDFIGGIRGLGALEERVAAGWAVAFSLYPTTLDDLMDIANAGLIMPPKSTWFEPKLRSGLFIHSLS